jgi:simple sugar transport system permease protein
MGGLILLCPHPQISMHQLPDTILALAVLIFDNGSGGASFWHIVFWLMKLCGCVFGIPFLQNLPIRAMFKMIPYIAPIIVLIFSSKSSQAPKASEFVRQRQQITK